MFDHIRKKKLFLNLINKKIPVKISGGTRKTRILAFTEKLSSLMCDFQWKPGVKRLTTEYYCSLKQKHSPRGVL